MVTDGVSSSSNELITVIPVETLAGNSESSNISHQLVKKLRDAGYHSLQSIVVLGARQISIDIPIGLKSSQRICCLASMKLGNSAGTIKNSSSNYLRQYHYHTIRIRTGSKVLDYYLGGGIELGGTTEFYGKSASGKTQLCHTISVTSQTSQLKCPSKSTNENRLNKVIYIDTEGSFSPERVEQIARARGLKGEEVMKNVTLLECYTVFEQEQCLKYVCELLNNDNSFFLIIVDSVIVHFRAEYIGRSVLPERQQRLNSYLNTLSRIARIYKVAVVITNQEQSTPIDNWHSNHTDGSTGGNILSHASTHRIRLNRPFENVYAKIIKSPYQHSSLTDARFTITDKGIDDLEDELKLIFHRNQQTRSTRNTFN